MSDPVEHREAALSAGLQYVTDQQPGIKRVGRAGHFRYVLASGKALKDRATLKRIESLVIPPAWTRVWRSDAQARLGDLVLDCRAVASSDMGQGRSPTDARGSGAEGSLTLTRGLNRLFRVS